ncbi:SMI1/KNR4 family protein [Bacillus cereus]|uniref:SMI1/KNR4 family protein n=1 Tax=Bacillus sp. AFS023182 TaxID=2033492 RepID=UPI000BF95AF7|nr:SMI1/KNR4 family protein [Bacillus sp. AFS023182]PFD97138.1 SMI1/KNR4 family protein [Bacillus sp. AFS023182]PGY02525.1 SMI1/KNR4 family protein [Bacillus cereus]
MNLNFEYTFKQIKAEDIEIFERLNGLELPEDYKSFLLRDNGGKSNRRRFTTKDDVVTSSIMMFFPLSEETENNLQNYLNYYIKGNKLPSRLIPIGKDPADNIICMSIQGSDIGSVYHCHTYQIKNEEELEAKFIREITSSFTEFINKLSEK